DVLTSLDLKAMMAYHKEKGGLGVLHLIKVEDPSAFGCVVHDEAGRISAFVEKPKREEAPTDEVNAGTYLLERSVLDMIPAGRNVSIERETFPKILSDGNSLYAYTTSDYWIDLGRPEHYLDAHRDILLGRMPLQLEPGLTGSGSKNVHGENVIAPVHLDTDVEIADGARVGPNVVLGKGCRVQTGASIRDSVLWDAVTVGENAQIQDTIIASRSRVGKNVKIGSGSVIGHDTQIEDGTVLEPGARVGAKAPLAQAR
ncbi:MAG TPA: NDP-sugar synthase, partial [Candidatus Baltobacteraceae bacterium]|nr:NDP-sugar synthase [Candidatus Baltobacteraceae bacterium]